MTALELELREKKYELLTVLQEAIEIYRVASLTIINQKFGIDAGFDERRNLASEVSMMTKRAEKLCRGNDPFDELTLDTAEQVKKYITNPTADQWDKIHGYGIPGICLTLWQGVRRLDQTFPTTGRTTKGRKIIKEWERIPDPEIVDQALRAYTYINA